MKKLQHKDPSRFKIDESRFAFDRRDYTLEYAMLHSPSY